MSRRSGGWPANPVVHEVFTWAWLTELGGRVGRSVTLADVPPDAWDDIAGPGVDAVWLMGVWVRSPMGAAIARAHPGLSSGFRAVLPDLVPGDVVGSAYCVRDYVVDRRLGGDDGLSVARAALTDRGVRLVLDFVPNHVAVDHPWTTEHPEYFIHGDDGDLAADPASFVRVGDRVLACGRDPYFPAWTDVVQLDTSRADVREAAAAVVGSIAERSDGVRCDMAMLVLDDVFQRTWAGRAAGGPQPDGGRGYWPTVIGSIRRADPEFAFWAEAYWGTEPALLEQGFDACYDKVLYDRLVQREPASAVMAAVTGGPGGGGGGSGALRFAENHDEPRLASRLEPAEARAAAVVTSTLPGVALLHQGQSEGRLIRIPVQLGRGPREPVDTALVEWYGRLMAAIGGGMRRGGWAPAPVEGWPDNRSCERLVAWTWTADGFVDLVVVNLGADPADGRVALEGVPTGPIELSDLLSGDTYNRDGEDITTNGLDVALDGHGVHLLRRRV